MKRTMGNLNMTVVAVLIIALLSAFFFYTLWPMIRNNFAQSTSCDRAICEATPNGDGSVDCVVYYDDGTSANITCAWKG